MAACAYRAGEKIKDETTGLTHDFTQKHDVLKSEILLPEGAPEWMAHRPELWNAVEKTEKRKDSQVAREINIALPKELTHEQNWELAKAFVKNEFVSKGMVADLNFHAGHEGQEEQPHVHVMLTMREITKDGFGKKVTAWNDRELLKEWRQHWAEHCNRELARQGLDVSIDHRTLKEQGIHLEPQSKIGAKSAQIKMARFLEHQALAERNGERLLNDPGIALHAITRQQSTFTYQDIARFVNRHTVGEEQFKAVYEKVKVHPELVHVGKDDKQRDRYTTREMLQLETQMLEQANGLLNKTDHAVAPRHQERALESKPLSAEQKEAFLHLTKAGDMACVVGFAGTGKSYMLDVAREAWEKEGYRVKGMALSGIAAENLEGGSGIKSHTVASRLWLWDKDREHLTSKDIVVVDEAGMLGSRQMAKIMEEGSRAGAKIVLVGDPEQLQAIEAGAAYRAIAEKVGSVEMNEIRRQSEPWQQQATRDFATKRTDEGLKTYNKHDNVHVFTSKEEAMTGMIAQWDEARSQAPDKSQIMLAYTRDEVQHLNTRARAMRHAQGELGQNQEVETAKGKRMFAEGDRIYFLRNENRELNVKNGSLGTIEKMAGDKLQVRLDRSGGGKSHCIQVNLKEYNDLDHGYAATVYKAQGVTVDRSHVLASAYFDRHSTYVAMSRHRDGADVYYDRGAFPSFARLSQSLGRERSKDTSLDYAETRGFNKMPERKKGIETNKPRKRKCPSRHSVHRLGQKPRHAMMPYCIRHLRTIPQARFRPRPLYAAWPRTNPSTRTIQFAYMPLEKDLILVKSKRTLKKTTQSKQNGYKRRYVHRMSGRH